MPIKGSLSDLSIADILQMLSIGNKSGKLALTNEENLVYIYLDSGDLVNVYWMNREDKLGNILVQNDIISEDELQNALKIQEKEDEIPLGKILLKEDFVDKDILKKYLKKQMRDTIIELSSWHQGTFVFKTEDIEKFSGVQVLVKIDDVLLESAALQDELKASSIPDKDSILARSPDIDSLEEFNEDERVILEKIDGESSFQSIINSLSMEEFKILKIMSNLIDRDVIKEIGSDKRALEKDKSKTVEHRNLGIAFIKIGLLDEALREINRIIELKPSDPEALFYRGVIKFKKDSLEESRKSFNKSFENMERGSTLNNIAVIMDIMGNREEALEFLRKVEQIDGDDDRILLNKTIILIHLNRIEEAKELLDKIGSNTDYTDFIRAYIMANMGKYEEALDILESGIEQNPDFEEYYYNLGKLYEAFGEKSKAVKTYKNGLSMNPDARILNMALIDYYYKNKMFDLCEKRIENLLKSDFEDGELFFKKGNILFKKGKRNEAIECWERALELEPNNETIKKTLDMATDDENS